MMKILLTTLLMMCIGLLLCLGCQKAKEKDVTVNTTTIQYEQSMDIFPNPERGFIHNLIVYSEGSGLSTSTLASLKGQSVSMILRFYYLEKFKDKAISDTELSLIQSDMNKLRDAGVKCVLRFAYTDDMAGTDAPLTIIEQHLDQLKPIFEENSDVIAFFQAGFIGAWGEWHSSSNGLATAENEKTVLFKILSVLPVGIMVQVRTPGVKQQIFNNVSPIESGIAYTSDMRARVGHHNDCFLTGGTDYGTYSNVIADKNYISNEALYVPTGGETCPPEATTPGCQTATAEMKLLKWTYLNLDYYQPTLDVWRNSGCFEDFQRSLGYRLLLVSANLPNQVVADQDYKLDIKLTNRGFAPLYNSKITSLIFKNIVSGTSYPVELPVEIRACKPYGLLAITQNVKTTGIPTGDYELYLKITDSAEKLKNRIEYSVRLANTTTWDETSGMNKLNHQVKITAQ